MQSNLHACGLFKCCNIDISFKACRSHYEGNISRDDKKIAELQPMLRRKNRELYSLKGEYSTYRCPVATPPDGLKKTTIYKVSLFGHHKKP